MALESLQELYLEQLKDLHSAERQIIEALPGLVESVSIGKPTLEDVFIDLTGRRFVRERGVSS